MLSHKHRSEVPAHRDAHSQGTRSGTAKRMATEVHPSASFYFPCAFYRCREQITRNQEIKPLSLHRYRQQKHRQPQRHMPDKQPQIMLCLLPQNIRIHKHCTRDWKQKVMYILFQKHNFKKAKHRLQQSHSYRRCKSFVTCNSLDFIPLHLHALHIATPSSLILNVIIRNYHVQLRVLFMHIIKLQSRSSL